MATSTVRKQMHAQRIANQHEREAVARARRVCICPCHSAIRGRRDPHPGQKCICKRGDL